MPETTPFLEQWKADAAALHKSLDQKRTEAQSKVSRAKKRLDEAHAEMTAAEREFIDAVKAVEDSD